MRIPALPRSLMIITPSKPHSNPPINPSIDIENRLCYLLIAFLGIRLIVCRFDFAQKNPYIPGKNLAVS